MKEEIPYIHYLRILACLGVLTLHCNNRIIFNNDYDAIFAKITHTLAQPCVPLFFMITGALILTPYKEKTINMAEFYKKRIPKVLFPLITWAIIYAILPYFTTDAKFKSVIYNLIWIPFPHPKEIGGILWYLYVLIGLYLAIPFFSVKIYREKHMLNAYLIIWFITSLGLIIRLYNPYIMGESKWINSYETLIYFSGYYGFLLLGFKLHNTIYVNKKITNFLLLIIVFIITYMVREELFGINWGHKRGWFIFPTSIIVSYLTYQIFKDFKFNKRTIIYKISKHISKYTFGIYLSHMTIYYLLTKDLLYKYNTSWYTQIATILLTFIMSYILCRLIERLPFSKIIIGV